MYGKMDMKAIGSQIRQQAAASTVSDAEDNESVGGCKEPYLGQTFALPETEEPLFCPLRSGSGGEWPLLLLVYA